MATLYDKIQETKTRALAALGGAKALDALEKWRIAFLGSKGRLRELMAALKQVDKAEKPAAGKALNELKNALQTAFKAHQGSLGAAASAAKGPQADVTLPGERPRIGHTHILTQTINEICDIFGRMGFTVAYGPEVEDEWHSFDALNTPPEHPARDPLESFYIDEGTILRSQTSNVQIRVMESQDPPVRVIAPGRVYRPDTVDATHYFMFHQVEGLYVAEGVSMADLKTCIDQFCKAYFGPRTRTRFRPHFFPFTEPSAEVDMSCPFCERAEGVCGVCKDSRWIEMAGCGMVDPAVMAAVGYDNEKYTGFAFGMGIDRMACVRHKIHDIRVLFENDIRFLHQF